jgi:hypothetical protein
MKIIFFLFLAIVFDFPNAVCAQISQDAGKIAGNQTPVNLPIDRSAATNSAVQSRISFNERKAFIFKQKLTKEQKARILPETDDSAKYASFLQLPKTGLIKLFRDAGCEENANVVRVGGECANWIPNSAFYSFREREHTIEYLADIRLEKEFLVSDGKLSQGILVELGNIPVENVTLNTAGMNYLLNYQPEPKNRDAHKQIVQLTKGIKSDGFLYRNILPAAVGKTYALRAIAYKGRFLQTFRGFIFNVLEGDERTDLTLVFRIVRKSEDGSITLLWKEVERQNAPKIIYVRESKNKKRIEG